MVLFSSGYGTYKLLACTPLFVINAPKVLTGVHIRVQIVQVVLYIPICIQDLIAVGLMFKVGTVLVKQATTAAAKHWLR